MNQLLTSNSFYVQKGFYFSDSNVPEIHFSFVAAYLPVSAYLFKIYDGFYIGMGYFQRALDGYPTYFALPPVVSGR